MRKQKTVWRSQVTGVGWGSRPLGLRGTFEDPSFASLSDLTSRDLLVAVKTGSDKTLSFLIPVTELIVKLKFMHREGTGTFGVLKKLMTHHVPMYGLIVGAVTGLLKPRSSSYIKPCSFLPQKLEKLKISQEFISLKKEPVYVGVDDDKDVMVGGLEQGYIVCPSEKRFLLLFTFLKKNRKKKVVVFFSLCMSVKYHYELLSCIDLPVFAIHRRQKQIKQATTFFQFCNTNSWMLLSTDPEGCPEVYWIAHYDPCSDPKEYIRHVDRTARGLDGKGQALLILCPEELGSIHVLHMSLRLPLSQADLQCEQFASGPPFIDLNVSSHDGKLKKRGGGGGFGYQKTKKVEKSKIFKHISKKTADCR
ncbi:LOW QUALITY PROTEIN: hypothetical protein U0070_014009, partial [Myodes glareolus]